MMKIVRILLLTLSLAACTSHGPKNIQTDFDKSTNFAVYKTFAIEAVQQQDELFKINDMISAVLITQLEAKGMQYITTENPDLLIRFLTQTTSGQQLKTEHIPTGVGIHTRYNMEVVNEGEFLLNVVDNKTKKVVWKASSIRDMSGIELNQFTSEKITNGLGRILEDFPPQSQ